MKLNQTMHDQQLEALADSLVERLWRRAILPGIGLQLALFVAFSFALGLASISAQDQEPPAIVASLPDEGQPPAPAIEVPAAANEDANDKVVASETIKPETIKPEVGEKAAKAETVVPQPAVKDVPPAEVASVEQIEQLGAKTPEPNAVRELSVEPVLETRPMLPADRPAWVGAPNDTSERVHRLYVASFTTAARDEVEADEMLDDPLVAAVRRYLDESLFPGEGAMDLHITPEFVRSNFLDNSTSYVAAMTTQSGTEYQKWVVLKVTPEQREYLADLLREHKQRQRMAVLGVGLVGVLGLTALANLLFNRRRQRYPNTLTPITMAIMPGNGPGNGPANGPGNGPGNAYDGYQNSLGNNPGNAVQYVAAAAPLARQAPRKKRSFVKKAFIMLVAVGLVGGLMFPWVVKVKRGPHRTEATRVEVDGKIWEIKTTRPLFETEY